MINRRRKWLIGLGILLILLIGFRIALPSILLRNLNWALTHKMDSYTGHVRDLSLSLWRGAYQLEGVTIAKINGGESPLVQLDQADLGISWRGLFLGRLSCNIILDGLIIEYTDSGQPIKPTQPTKTDWRSAFDTLIPVEINSLEIHRSELRFTNSQLKRPVSVSLSNIEGTVENLRTRRSATLSPLKLTAVLQNHAQLKIEGGVDALASPPRFDLNATLINFNMRTVNKLLLAYIPLDITKGRLSLYSETASARGKGEGYAKVFLKDADVIADKQNFRSGGHFIAEILGGFANWFLQNSKTRSVAFIAPFRWNAGSFDVNTSAAFWSSLRNEDDSLKEGLNQSISLELFDQPDQVKTGLATEMK